MVIGLYLIILVLVVAYQKFTFKDRDKVLLEFSNNMEKINDLYVSNNLVTNELYEYVMGEDLGDDDKPVTNVSWYDAISFCNSLSVLDNLMPVYTINGDVTYFNSEADGYRLPTLQEYDFDEDEYDEWLYDSAKDKPIHKVVVGGDTTSELPTYKSDKISFRVVKGESESVKINKDNSLIVYYFFDDENVTSLENSLSISSYKITLKKPYSKDYEEEAIKDITNNHKRELKGKIKNINDLEVIFLGYENVSDYVPMPVITFLDSYKLTNKVIVPFCTGDGCDESFADLKAHINGFRLGYGINIDDVSENEISDWLSKNGLVF